jgi:DNA-binding LacI/PurR family transcriptional regulator
VVRSADDDGVSQAVTHLVQLGHQRIAYVAGPRGPITQLRRSGYETAMIETGLGEQIRIIDGGLSEADGARAAEAILAAEHRPTGIVAFNDRCAIGIVDAVNREGIDVPAAMSVIGFDDSPVASLPQIDLTTVAQDTGALTSNAVRSVIERLDDDRRTRREVIIAPQLIVRGTTGPAPAETVTDSGDPTAVTAPLVR